MSVVGELERLLLAPASDSAALFDLDGTLVDSVGDIALAVNLTLAQEGLPEVSVHRIDGLMGYPISLILAEAGIHRDIAAAVARFRLILPEVMGTHSTVFPGVREVLEELSVRGFALGVATNKPRHLAVLALERAGLVDWFPVVSGSETLPPKPDPAIVIDCMGQLGCANGVMIGDTVLDVSASVAAGLAAIGIAGDTDVQEAMRTNGAVVVVSSMDELAQALTS